ncbi:MAG: IS1595 family transposase [Candidatus Electryonea clarkiae]|nr:IS1595 family transposase [Candidatus Electryonea clarkiae]MDP8288323.1 IS1595 family transposase [Candidatus Electryonea clarkiae]
MAKVLSFFDFQEFFATEHACFDYLFKIRWPNGFICPRCHHDQASFVSTRKLFQCCSCRYQASVTAGTVFHKLRQPLQKLFLAVFLFSTSKKGISAMELQRKTGIKSYKTAWLLLHKLRKGMKSTGIFPLTDPVELDETYIGGSRQGTTGRGAEDKVLVAIAIETRNKKKMGRAYMKPIKDAGKKELGQFVKEHIQPAQQFTLMDGHLTNI